MCSLRAVHLVLVKVFVFHVHPAIVEADVVGLLIIGLILANRRGQRGGDNGRFSFGRGTATLVESTLEAVRSSFFLDFRA